MVKKLGIFGIGIVMGITIYKFIEKGKKRSVDNTAIGENKTHNKEDIYFLDRSLNYADNDLDKNKSVAIDKIYIRHKEASKAMNNAMDIILNNSQFSGNMNQKLDKISDELDKLLNEG